VRGFLSGLCLAIPPIVGLAGAAFPQQVLTWQQVKDKFESANLSLLAGQIGIAESGAAEITAHLRPNPNLSLTADQLNLFPGGPSHSTFGSVLSVASVSYLDERQRKRELRFESAREATGIATSAQADLERAFLFNLRMAFVQVLQEKAMLDLAQENLAYYDHVLDVNRDRDKVGAIAQVDLDRLELQRVLFESDLRTADVNLRTAKIQLLTFLNDRTPVEQFGVTGPFDFSAQIVPLDDVRKMALDMRSDLRAALQSADKAKTDHRLSIANGSTDPTFGFDVGRNPPIDQYIGFSVNIPLRIFDRNQGEKLRTQLDINRNEKMTEATRTQVFRGVDSAYAAVTSSVLLLQPYRDRYVRQASRVRDTIALSYEHGAASFLDYLNAQADYRSVQNNYLSLVGSYLDAANQLNLAVGREVIP